MTTFGRYVLPSPYENHLRWGVCAFRVPQLLLATIYSQVVYLVKFAIYDSNWMCNNVVIETVLLNMYDDSRLFIRLWWRIV